MNIAVVGNVNLSPIASRLRDLDVEVLDVGALAMAMAPTGPLWGEHAPRTLFVHVDAEVMLAADDPDIDSFVLASVEAYAAANPSTLVMCNTWWLTTGTPRSHADATTAQSAIGRRAAWDSAVIDLARSHANVGVVDLPATWSGLRRDEIINWNYWYLGRIRYSAPAMEVLANAYRNVLDGHTHRARKVLVLDLDNTLWGGVLGEDGIGGIALSEDGKGRCFRDLQRSILDLASCGVLIAVVSKNDPEYALAAMDDHPMMLIRSSRLVTHRIGWGDKATAIRSIAEELGLGADSLVFIDDNPVERALVQTEMPLVGVPDVPDRAERLSDWFVSEVVPTYFPRLRILDEDTTKTEQYRARKQRRDAEDAGTDLTTFLETLDMRIEFQQDERALIERVAQLTQKTNQFNLTTQRADQSDVASWMDSDAHLVVTCSYRDRFGDDGVVGAAIVDLEHGELLNLMLSCRVLGRGVEHELMEYVCNQVRLTGHQALLASFSPTERNGVASGYLRNEGFEPLTPDDDVFRGRKAL